MPKGTASSNLALSATEMRSAECGMQNQRSPFRALLFAAIFTAARRSLSHLLPTGWPPIDHNQQAAFHLTRYPASCTICPVVLDGELAVPSRFNRTVPATRCSRVEFLL